MRISAKLKQWVSVVMMGCLVLGLVIPAGYAAEMGQAASLQISHNAPASIPAQSDYTVKADITGGGSTVTAAVYYKVNGSSEERVPLVLTGTNAQGMIAADKLSGAELEYYIAATDEEASTSAKTDTYKVNILPQAPAGPPAVQSLLITELVPDTKNKNSADAYEYVEVYNNTDAPIHFSDFYFYYYDKDKWTSSDPNIVIPAHKPIVFWIMNGNNNTLQASDFTANYGLTGNQLVENSNLFRISGGGGMANSARTLQIKSVSGDVVISSAKYEATDVKENMGIVFRLPAQGKAEMDKLSTSGTLPATPGIVEPNQLIPVAIPSEGDVVIQHTPVTSTDVQDLDIKATVKFTGEEKPVELQYKTASQDRYKVVPMVKNETDYTAKIPVSALVEPKLEYKIVAGGKSESYSVNVNLPVFDAAKVPQLLITEAVPNTLEVPGTKTDAYEFVEVYNNTDQPINFKNYKLYYRYPDKGPASDVTWAATEPNFSIPSQQTVVFWVQNSVNSSYTAKDFNDFYKTNLELNKNLFIVKSDGMANSGARGLAIKTNTEKEISAAYYDSTIKYAGAIAKDETLDDKALLYKYPMNGTTEMIKISSGLKAPTPGTVDSFQVPSTPVHVVPDNVLPVVEDLTTVKETDQSASVNLKAKASDNVGITSMELYLGRVLPDSDNKPVYIKYNLFEDYNDGLNSLYHFNLSPAYLIGRESIYYYFVVSDGTHEAKTEPKQITITGGPDNSSLRLNVKDKEFVHGTTVIKGTAKGAGPNDLELSVDSKSLATGISAALEHDAYFVFDVKGVDYYFKNAVTMGPEELGEKSILYTFMDPIVDWQTMSYPISADRLKSGSDNVIFIRAASKSSPFDPRKEENKDDFEVKNVRLLLADGTEIWNSDYPTRDQEIKMGDSSGRYESVGFRFNLKPELFKSLSFAWDTSQITDGEHGVTLKHGTEQVASKVIVDNTAPSIEPTVADGREYRGSFTIDAKVADKYAGLDKVEVKLDGNAIKLPYETSSGKLNPGEHTLQISASDKIGNKADKKVTFRVPSENPLAPVLVAPTNGQANVGANPQLTVKVQDPSGDDMNVSFYRGFKYDGNRAQGFTGYKNSADTEPPKEMIPSGETALTKDEYAQIRAVDGKYLVNDAVDKFPYQRYEIELDPSVKKTDPVDIEWRGHSIAGRKVSLYAWSQADKAWKSLDHVIAGNEDFELKATVLAGEYAIGNKIQIMVQDEIAPAASGSGSPVTNDRYDFSFVWMSDTQYYSESYPYIYQKNVKWIADQAQKMNIKYVIHTGDIVDKSYQEYQWQEADRDMKVLEDANIPYGVLAGNHDVNHQNNDYTEYWKYFGEDRFKKMPTFAGSYDNNRGHYDLVSAGGNDFIIVYMGWGLADKEIEWMDQVIKQYPERKAIIALHEYLLVSGNRAPIADKVFEKVVKPNKNVIAALSGHYHDAELKVDELDDNGDGTADRKVYQMLADYQGAEQGGLGYIRLMQFDMENNMLHIKTYSPYLDDYNFYDPKAEPKKDEFSLPLDLKPATKRVATDYFGVKVYSDQLIGVKNKVKSGSNVSVAWNNLKEGYYQWYVKAEDQNSGGVLSDIWGFSTGAVPGGNQGGNDQGNGNGNSGNNNGSTGNNNSSGSGSKSENPNPTPGTKVTESTIELSPGKDGSYKLDNSAVEKALQGKSADTIILKLSGSQDQGNNLNLTMDTKGLELVKSGKQTIKVVAPSVVVELPGTSLPKVLTDADQLVLRVDTTLNSAIKASMDQQANAAKGFKSRDLVYSVTMAKVKGQQETEVEQLPGPITIERTLSDAQRQAFDPEYAGIYRLSGGKAEYIGGIFSGNVVRFTADQMGEYAIIEYHKSFDDLTGSWARDYIQKLTAKHIITGVDEQRFAPNSKVTRADFAVLAVRALKLAAGNSSSTAESSSSNFSDVSQDAYYASFIAKAAELGLVQGQNGKFRPADTITREEAASILIKLSELMAKKPTGSTSSLQSFADNNQVSPWAKDAVTKAQSLGLIQGKSGGKFDPKGYVTRAEIAKMLYSFLDIAK
ncbi:S-layer homology domain-containing protein [Paenibacillus puldeungensis]|uniref:S-layer homology domain-containing protein n=1 Tax=Paenibacillus puldeungensis TaxID=696536 RepID=A0ABW3RY08_9BACL